MTMTQKAGYKAVADLPHRRKTSHSPAITTATSVMLCQLSSTEWRVLDGRFEPTELRALLGFIHASGEGFEAVRMDAPNRGRFFVSLADAKADFARHPINGG